MSDFPRVLIVGTVPYNKRTTSRAFDAYFHFWKKDRIAQIFSDSNEPLKGHCSKLYQITDAMILKKWLRAKGAVGRAYDYDELSSEDEQPVQPKKSILSLLYWFGRKHTPLTHLLRHLLWQKRHWCTEELEKWVKDFGPECIFLAFSDDFFINEIALYFSEKYSIPIISCIGDDYYFNEEFSLNPFYWLYKKTYKRLIRKVFTRTKNCIFISEKIKDKYVNTLNTTGGVVYLTSSVERKAFTPIDTINPLITYCGNIRMGRNESLCDIGKALHEINRHYAIEVYSGEVDKRYITCLQKSPGIKYMGAISYKEVKEKQTASDIVIIVEGFKPEDVNLSRYSLSTKAADSLASGAMILTYGSSECGIVNYMEETKASVVCTQKRDIKQAILDLLEDQELQKRLYDQEIQIVQQNHTLERSCATSLRLITEAIKKESQNDVSR